MGSVILLVFAFVFFCIAAFLNVGAVPAPAPWYGRFHFGWAGLAAWSLADLIAKFPSAFH